MEQLFTSPIALILNEILLHSGALARKSSSLIPFVLPENSYHNL
jgi:hypothetical protein